MKVRKQVVRILTTQHALDPDAIGECLHAIAENLHMIAIFDPIKRLKGVVNHSQLLALARSSPISPPSSASAPSLESDIERSSQKKSGSKKHK
jgi:hypothetical protein